MPLPTEVVQGEGVEGRERLFFRGRRVGLVKVNLPVLEGVPRLPLHVFLEAPHVEVPHVLLHELPLIRHGRRVQHPHQVGEARASRCAASRS